MKAFLYDNEGQQLTGAEAIAILRDYFDTPEEPVAGYVLPPEGHYSAGKSSNQKLKKRIKELESQLKGIPCRT